MIFILFSYYFHMFSYYFHIFHIIFILWGAPGGQPIWGSHFFILFSHFGGHTVAGLFFHIFFIFPRAFFSHFWGHPKNHPGGGLFFSHLFHTLPAPHPPHRPTHPAPDNTSRGRAVPRAPGWAGIGWVGLGWAGVGLAGPGRAPGGAGERAGTWANRPGPRRPGGGQPPQQSRDQRCTG
jgi:hypothetical protein